MIYPQPVPVGIVSYPNMFACSERGKQTSFFDLPQVSLLCEEINTSMDHSGEARMS